MGFTITDTGTRCPDCRKFVDEMEEHACPKSLMGVEGEPPEGRHVFETLDGDKKHVAAHTIDGAWRLLATMVDEPRRWIHAEPIKKETAVGFLSRHPDEDLLSVEEDDYHEHNRYT